VLAGEAWHGAGVEQRLEDGAIAQLRGDGQSSVGISAAGDELAHDVEGRRRSGHRSSRSRV